MNCFKRITWAAIAAFFVFVLAGCAKDEAYLRAQADAISAQAQARVKEAEARIEEAKTARAFAERVNGEGATAYLLTGQLKGALGAGAQPAPVATVKPAPGFLDYLAAFNQTVGTIGNIAVPWITVKENARTQRALSDNSVLLERARQGGESERFNSAMGSMERLGVAGTNADRGAHITITAGGDVATEGSSIARLTCQASGGNWTPTVPPATVAGTNTLVTPPSLSGPAGAATSNCTR